MDHLSQVVKAAREAGMSYGRYVALMHEQGKRPLPKARKAPAAETPEQEKRICVICGGVIPRERKNAKTCGSACSYELNKRRNRELYQNTTKFKPKGNYKCDWCGGEFTPNRRFQRFCGEKCQEAHKRAVRRGERVPTGITPGMANRSYGTGECVICGEDFTKKSARQITCCKGCRKEYYARQRKEKKC